MPRVKNKRPATCLVCLAKLEDSFQLIFDEDGRDLNLQQLLVECFSLEIKENKSKVQALCDPCLNQLIDEYDLKEAEKNDSAETSGQSMELKTITPKVEIFGEPPEQKQPPQTLGDMKSEKESSSDTEVNEDLKRFYEEYLVDEEELLEDGNSDTINPDRKVKDEASDEEMLNEENMIIESLSDSQPEILEEDSRGEMMSEALEEIEHLGNEEPENLDENSSPAVEEPLNKKTIFDEPLQDVDFAAYKKNTLASTFDDITFPAAIQCRFCKDNMNSHNEILKHTQDKHCVEDFAYPCIIDFSCENQKSEQELSYHVAFKHYDLENLILYAHCQECDRRFSNFITFNKHSCYSGTILSRGADTCEICKKTMKSNKRYRFHHQFHLEKHRPPACFICDLLFTDEDELFEHLNYFHESDMSLICIKCDKAFINEDTLNKHKLHHRLKRKYECKSCNKSYLDSQMLKDHVVAKHNKENKFPFKCDICGKCLHKRTLLNRHILSHNKLDFCDVMTCTQCGYVGDNETSVAEHIEKHHDNKTEPEMERINVALCCEYCEMAFVGPEKLNQHREDQHSEKSTFYCGICPLQYDEYKKLKTHKLTHQSYVDLRITFPVSRHYMCDFENCYKNYIHWTSLQAHKRNCHMIKQPINCDKCDQQFTSLTLYTNHVENAHGVIEFTCQLCGKKFNSRMAVSVHVARVHNPKKMKCSFCDRQYSSDYDLQRHTKSVHTVYKCDICSKVLKNSKNLIVHKEMVHEKIKRFFCSYCNKGYYNNNDRLDHEKAVHEKNLKYKCEQCDYSSVYKQSLIVHIKSHNNEFPFSCDLCPKQFRRPYSLKLHARRHRNIRDFKCPYEGCDSAYPGKGILNAHIRSRHENSDTNQKPLQKRPWSMLSAEAKQTVFVDDDDGLEGDDLDEMDEPEEPEMEETEVEDDKRVTRSSRNKVQQSNKYIVVFENRTEAKKPSVVVQKTKTDHDYIIQPDDEKTYGNIMEEYEIVEES